MGQEGMYETKASAYGHTGISFRSLTELREFLTAQGFTGHPDGFQKQIPEGVVVATFYGSRDAWHVAMKTVERLMYVERRFAAKRPCPELTRDGKPVCEDRDQCWEQCAGQVSEAGA